MQIPIERYTLDNGLRVVLSQDHTLPVVSLNLWYNVGSRNEVPGRTGLAHLFEHMMFQGSQNVPDTQHVALVERAGGSINASTWLDRTNYYATLPASHLELGLWLESDRLGFFLPALTQEKFDNQREVVKNERRQRVDNAPYGDWDERMQRLLYPPDHPYHHSVIGSMDDLDAATLDDVRDFFRTFYAPDNGVLTLCGDFDRDEARRLIDRYFGPIPRGPGVPPLPGRPELDPLHLGREVRETVESAVAMPRVYVAFRVPPYGVAGVLRGGRGDGAAGGRQVRAAVPRAGARAARGPRGGGVRPSRGHRRGDADPARQRAARATTRGRWRPRCWRSWGGWRRRRRARRRWSARW